MTVLKDKLSTLKATYEQEKNKLEEELKKQRLLKIPKEEIELAELLHSKFCHKSHIDLCGWYYDEGDWTDSSRKRYLKKANSLLKIVNYKDALKVADALT